MGVKTRLDSWASSTTMHGWSHLRNEARSCKARCFWATIMLVFSLALILTVISTIRSRLLDTSWQANIEIVQNQGEPMLIPPFKVCPLARVSKRAAIELGLIDANLTDPSLLYMYYQTMLRAKYVFGYYDIVIDSWTPEARAEREKFAKWRQGTGMTSQEIIEYLAPSCESTLILLKHGYSTDNYFEVENKTGDQHVCEVGVTDTVRISRKLDDEFGLCYEIEMRQSAAKIEKAGRREAVTFMFMVDPSDQIPIVLNNLFKSGLAMKFRANDEDPVLLEPGTFYNITSRDECMVECEMLELWTKLINCSTHNEAWDYPFCEIEKIITDGWPRILPRLGEFANNSKHCQSKYCMPICDQQTIKLAIQKTTMASDEMLPELYNLLQDSDTVPPESMPKSPGELAKRMMQVNLYYETLDVMTITTYQKGGIANGLAELGGQLGLWAGVSLMTCVHFLGAVILPTLCFCCNCDGGDNKDDNESTLTRVEEIGRQKSPPEKNLYY